MKKLFRIIGLVIFLLCGQHLKSQCSGTPGSNSVIASQTIICPGGVVTMSLANTYTATGLRFQWYSSTISGVGPYAVIPGANQTTYTTNPLFTSTYFQCIITCTNSNQSTTSTFVYILVGPALTTSTVPYYESFEGITYTNQLPNCSWLAPNIGSTIVTYTASQSNNRVPRTGSKFAAFGLPSTNNVVYTNGIQMAPGITYSAALYFATEYFGYTNWTQLEILVGPNQSATGLVQVAIVSPAMSGPYQLLSGTYTVPSAGLYYVAIRATAATGNALYLSFDDLYVTIPCAGTANGATITVSPSSPTVCAGTVLTMTSTGADTYTWSTGTVGSVLTVTTSVGTNLFVSGTKTLTGCIGTKSIAIGVNPSPTVFLVASKNNICSGESVTLTSYGGNSYTWNAGGGPSPTIVLSPTITGCYTVTGANSYSCQSSSVICITVNPLPVIGATASAAEVCAGEAVILTASGGVSYQWIGFSPGYSVSALPSVSTIYTVSGTNVFACVNTNTVNVKVNSCTALNQNLNISIKSRILPNPNTGEFTIESQSEAGFKVIISDALGRIIAQQETKNKTIALDLKDFPNGVYYSKIEYLNSVETMKVIKE